jgi:hypothetical protein
MIPWIESQDTAIIAVLVFALSYLLAAAIFVAGAAISRRRIAVELKATTPVMLTPLAVIAGLLIAFLASRVWSNVDRANAYVAQEASAIERVLLYSDNLPKSAQIIARDAMRKYIHFVDTEEWPAMAKGDASLRQLPPDLSNAMTNLLAYVPDEPGQQIAQQRAVRAIEQVLESRQDRVLLSKAGIAPIQWIVIVVLFALILLTIAMVHIDRPATVAVNLLVLSTAVAACLVLLMVNDRPFAAGGITVQPVALRELSPD